MTVDIAMAVNMAVATAVDRSQPGYSIKMYTLSLAVGLIIQAQPCVPPPLSNRTHTPRCYEVFKQAGKHG